RLSNCGVFALPLKGEEAEELVFLNRPANGATKPLPRIGGICRLSCSVAVRHFLVSVELLLAEEAKCGTMVGVGTGLGNHVDGSAGVASVDGREALRGNLEFLHGFGWHLHHRPADRIIFVVNTVNGDVHVASAVAIDGKDRVTVLGGIVGISGFNAGSQISEV